MEGWSLFSVTVYGHKVQVAERGFVWQKTNSYGDIIKSGGPWPPEPPGSYGYDDVCRYTKPQGQLTLANSSTVCVYVALYIIMGVCGIICLYIITFAKT